jgi:hypothetical protein
MKKNIAPRKYGTLFELDAMLFNEPDGSYSFPLLSTCSRDVAQMTGTLMVIAKHQILPLSTHKLL